MCPSSHGISCRLQNARKRLEIQQPPFSCFYSLSGCLPVNLSEKMEQQFYQPLSAALHTPLQANHNPQPHYSSYASHATSSSMANGAQHTTQHNRHREEEEEEEDDEEAAEEDIDHRDQQSSVNSPRVVAVHPSKSAGCVHFTDAPEETIVTF